MDARLGPCTAAMSNSWRTSTCVPSVTYLASAGKTVSQTSRSWTVQSVPALRPYSSRPSCDGWDMSSGWTAIACPASCCMESLKPARESKAARASGTRTLYSGAASSRKNLRLQLVTEVTGAQ